MRPVSDTSLRRNRIGDISLWHWEGPTAIRFFLHLLKEIAYENVREGF